MSRITFPLTILLMLINLTHYSQQVQAMALETLNETTHVNQPTTDSSPKKGATQGTGSY